MLNVIEGACQWPSMMMVNKMVYLIKKSRVDRPMDLAQMVPCIWQAIRADAVRKWEPQALADHDTARPGASAEQTVYTRGVLA